jgi:hypothetical protein
MCVSDEIEQGEQYDGSPAAIHVWTMQRHYRVSDHRPARWIRSVLVHSERINDRTVSRNYLFRPKCLHLGDGADVPRQGQIPDDAFEGEDEVFDEDDLANELFEPGQKEDLMQGVIINRGGGEESESESDASGAGDEAGEEGHDKAEASQTAKG